MPTHTFTQTLTSRVKKLEMNQKQATATPAVSEVNQLAAAAAYYQAQLLFLANSACASTTNAYSDGSGGGEVDGRAVADYYKQLFGYTWNDRTPTSSDAEDPGTPLVSDVEQEREEEGRHKEATLDPFLGETKTLSDKPKVSRMTDGESREVRKREEEGKERRNGSHARLSLSPKSTQSTAAGKPPMSNDSPVVDDGATNTCLSVSNSRSEGANACDSRSAVSSGRNQPDSSHVREKVGSNDGCHIPTSKRTKKVCSAETRKCLITSGRTKSTHSTVASRSRTVSERALQIKRKYVQHRKPSSGLDSTTSVLAKDSCGRVSSPCGGELSGGELSGGHHRLTSSDSCTGKSTPSFGKEKELPPAQGRRTKARLENHDVMHSPNGESKMPQKYPEDKEVQDRTRGAGGKVSHTPSHSQSSFVSMLRTRSRSPSHDKENNMRRSLSLSRGKRPMEDMRSLRGSVRKHSSGRGGGSSDVRTSSSTSSQTDIENKRLDRTNSRQSDIRDRKRSSRSNSSQRDSVEVSGRRRVRQKRKHSCTPPQAGSQPEVKRVKTGSDITRPSSARDSDRPSRESSSLCSDQLASPWSISPIFDDITTPPTPNADEILPYCADVQLCENSALLLYDNECGQQSLLDISCPPTPTSELLDEEEVKVEIKSSVEMNPQANEDDNHNYSQNTEPKKACERSSPAVSGESCHNVTSTKDENLANSAQDYKNVEPKKFLDEAAQGVENMNNSQAKCCHDDKDQRSMEPKEEQSQSSVTAGDCPKVSLIQDKDVIKEPHEQPEQAFEAMEADGELEEGEITDSDEDSNVECQSAAKDTISTTTITSIAVGRRQIVSTKTAGCENITTFKPYLSHRDTVKRTDHERLERNHPERVALSRSRPHEGCGGLEKQRPIRSPPAAASLRLTRHLPLSERRNRHSPPSLKRSAEKLSYGSRMLRKHSRRSHHRPSNHRRPNLARR